MSLLSLLEKRPESEIAASLFNIGVQGSYYTPADYATRTLIGRSSATAYFVAQKKLTGTGGLLFLMETGVVTATDSVGGSAEFLRVTNVLDLVDCVAFKQHTSVSNAPDWTKVTPTYTGQAAGGAINDGTRYNRTTVQNAWIEYNVTVPSDGNLRIGFHGTTGSSTSVRVDVDGVAVDTFSLVTSPTNNIVIKTYAGVTAGARVVRITKLDAGTAGLQVFGPNFYSLSNLHTAIDGAAVDAMGYYRSANTYISNKGAADYAMSSATTDTFAGSYHGGETSLYSVLRSVGGAFSLASGAITAVSSLELEQRTLISWANGEQIGTTSITRFGKGQYALSYVMSGNVLAKHLYSMMSTTADTFDEVTAPISHTFTNTNATIVLGDVTSVTQRNASTSQTITNTFTRQDLTNNADGVTIKEVVGSYNKVYYGPIVTTDGVPFGGLQQLVVKKFEG